MHGDTAETVLTITICQPAFLVSKVTSDIVYIQPANAQWVHFFCFRCICMLGILVSSSLKSVLPASAVIMQLIACARMWSYSISAFSVAWKLSRGLSMVPCNGNR